MPTTSSSVGLQVVADGHGDEEEDDEQNNEEEENRSRRLS